MPSGLSVNLSDDSLELTGPPGLAVGVTSAPALTGETATAYIYSGDATATSGDAGVRTGNSTQGNSGNITLISGSGDATGNITIMTGDGATSAGDILIKAGNGTAQGGNLTLATGNGLLILATVPTSDPFVPGAVYNAGGILMISAG